MARLMLGGLIYSGIEVVPFLSEKDRYRLFPVDGVLVLLTYLKNQSPVPHNVNLLIACKKLLRTAEIEFGSLLEIIFEANALPLSKPTLAE